LVNVAAPNSDGVCWNDLPLSMNRIAYSGQHGQRSLDNRNSKRCFLKYSETRDLGVSRTQELLL
jgi:hypothetical protein